MKLLANENFPLASVLYLRNAGHDVVAIGIDYPGVSDKYVMDIAIAEQRTILTFDRDYGTLIYKHGYKPQQGVIYLRIADYIPHEPGEIVQSLLEKSHIQTERTYTVFDGKTLRQRKY